MSLVDGAHLQLPEGFLPLETQVAGHTFQTETAALGLLKDAASGCVFKPMGKPACGERELGFYESLQRTEDPVLAQLRPLVPTFHSKQVVVVNRREHTFLKLEDVTRGMAQPCVMDIKVGKRTWDPVATPQKREVEEKKYIRCKQTLGLCLPGFQVVPVHGGAPMIRHGKEYGKSLDAAAFRATIALFLNAQPTLCEPLVHEILQQLRAIRKWFSVQRFLHFYASSLLIAYDAQVLRAYLTPCDQLTNGAQDARGECSNGQISAQCHDRALPSPARWVKVKMIDFAHVFPAENSCLDTNYLFGLHNLITVLEELLIR